MRKRDALKIVLRNLKLPRLKEWEKLLYAGLTITISFTILGVGLTMYTGNWIWSLLAPVGFLIYTWFAEAGMVMRKEGLEELRKDEE